ncbi:hypothetical protein [Actinoplanes palleronii]|uniref:Uncharacterized protein n=1 Tax=Actinoplanes palleronii TaxID=113570 RepID=A0ABQ4B0E0_9ACTN|nr:hypothetical protein [Actinoplanes palleronii]GIE64131.1 hypothetical protein Apa02nite_002390 [Actinoplanes palleronii]
MGRKPPAPRAHRGETVAIDGLSAATIREIRAIERSHVGAGAVGRAVAGWRRAVHQPRARLLTSAAADCPCCDDLDDRDVLDQALLRLTGRARRELAAVVDPLDEIFLSRTHHDPATPPEWPWWRRRT